MSPVLRTVCAAFPLEQSEGAGIGSRKEAETGNRGPVIEAICFNKDMLLVVKQRFC